MWISKKKYNELVAQKDDFNRIATNMIMQNGRLLDDWHEAIEKMKEIQEFNRILVNRNEELVARCQELEEKLCSMRRQRDYYCELLEVIDEMEEVEEMDE